MRKRGKKYLISKKKIGNGSKKISIEEGVKFVKEGIYAKFDETVNLAVRLGVDPKQSDQNVRGAVMLPNGIGKEIRVVVFAKGEKEKEAKDANADYVGSEDIINKIQGGWLDFDRAIATPDMMGMVGKLGKILGPRGLMPNPKVGTVTFEIGKAVKESKKGKVEFKTDKGGIVHLPVGKVSFTKEALLENITAAIGAIIRLKPPSSKGTYLRNIAISSTMGVGIKIDPLSISV